MGFLKALSVRRQRSDHKTIKQGLWSLFQKIETMELEIKHNSFTNYKSWGWCWDNPQLKINVEVVAYGREEAKCNWRAQPLSFVFDNTWVASDWSKVPTWPATGQDRRLCFWFQSSFRKEVTFHAIESLKITLEIYFLKICMLEKSLGNFSVLKKFCVCLNTAIIRLM